MKYEHGGSCHCGGIQVKLRSDRSALLLPVRRCRCSYCIVQRARYTFDVAGRGSVSVREGSVLDTYPNNGTDFVRCGVCGQLIGSFGSIEGQIYGVISATLFVGLDNRKVVKMFDISCAVTATMDRRVSMRTRMPMRPFTALPFRSFGLLRF